MKQAIVTGLIGTVFSLPLIFTPTEEKIYMENTYETINICTTEDLQEKVPNYQRLMSLEKNSDSIHQAIKKLPKNETMERPTKKPSR